MVAHDSMPPLRSSSIRGLKESPAGRRWIEEGPMWRVVWVAIGALATAAQALGQGETRDLDLGGAVMPDERASFTPDPLASSRPSSPRADSLPVEERPEPAKQSPEYIPFLWERARSFHGKGWYLKACADFDSIKQVGGDLAREQAIVGRTYLACAQQAADQHDSSTALEQLAKARTFIGEVPEMARVGGTLARHQSATALGKGDIDEATRAFDEALKQEPDATDAIKFSTDLAHLARTAYQRDDMQRARQAVAASLRYFPENRLAQDVRRGIWLRDNMTYLILVSVLALLAVVALYVIWRRMRAARDEAALADRAARISDDELDDEGTDLDP
jgi:tetratricopeptide (TPR) repeat protein